MGRRLYGEWSEYWPGQGPEVPFSEYINTIPKYVLSTTLDDPTWQNTTVLSGDVAAKVQGVKDSTDGDVTMSGSATTVRWLLANGLLDELALLVHPIAVGSGRRLFEDTATQPPCAALQHSPRHRSPAPALRTRTLSARRSGSGIRRGRRRVSRLRSWPRPKVRQPPR